MSSSPNSPATAISLPKGGGAQHGIGEKFAPDLHTGTGNFTVPITLPPGRNGLQPQLSLVYSTGNGNGPLGLGWALSVPGVSRQTSKRIPKYDDAKDTFILSGTEELVPVETTPGKTRYRPRTEGMFARVYHLHDPAAGDDCWEVHGKDGLVSLYGTRQSAGSDPAVIADPAPLKRGRVFAWKLTETRDIFGNRIEYRYITDEPDSPGPDVHEWSQPLLREIRYADYTERGATKFLVSVTFEYEEREDAFSEYRSGFEIRTTKRCKAITVRTHADRDRLVRTYALDYETDPHNGLSLLRQVKVLGYDDENRRFEELPPLEFGYTRFEPHKRRFIPLTGADLPPLSLAHPDYEQVDLFGGGLPDILEMNSAVRYWRNLGGGRFDRPREMASAQAGLRLADKGVQLIDANGDGQADLLVVNDQLAGYFPLRFDGPWESRTFRRYSSAPSFDLGDPEVRLVDLDGDGVTDAIRSGARLECFFNDPRKGWGEVRHVERRSLDESPNVNFSDPHVKWADMTGDGLQDVVLVYDGKVEYWPNIGYGNWAKRVTMRDSPRLPFGYDPKRILIGDVDGDGLADFVYVDDNKVTLWINRSGNGWSDPVEIKGTPSVSDTDAVRLADMLGSGIGGVLWSADANGGGRDCLRFLDFTGGVKPYLLTEMRNNIGSLTRVEYAPSTRFYLEDEKRPETRWKTTLPFPVQVVTRVEVIDALSGGKLTTEYRYHHGHWDGAEREFRGFGRVDQRDTETFEGFNAGGLQPAAPFERVGAKAFSPPTETRTWFHQGPAGDEFGEWRETDFSDEFYSGDPQALGRPAEMIDALKALPRRDLRDALRSLRGSILRTESYALDGTVREGRPYTVTESLYGVREEGPPRVGEQERRRVFFPHALARRVTQWERGDDPLTQFTFTDDYDAYGQPRSQTAVAVPRGRAFQTAAAPGDPYLATQTVTTYANRDDARRYVIGRVARATIYEIINDGSPGLSALRAGIADGSTPRRVIGQTLNFYDGPAFQGMPFGQLGEHGVVARVESLFLTERTLHEAYRSGETAAGSLQIPPYLIPGGDTSWTADYPQEFRDYLPPLAGYVYRRGGPGSQYAEGYFAVTERRRYDCQDDPGGKGRGLLLATRDPLGHETTLTYDAYDLLPVEVTDAAGLTTRAKYNYRVLQPFEVTDPNGNRTVAAFTPLGLPSTTAVMGKRGENVGDTPEEPGSQLLYDFLAFAERGEPISVRTIRRVHHASETDIASPVRDEKFETVEYSDGFGRLLQTRTQAEELTFGDPLFGDAGLAADRSLPAGEAAGRQRVAADAPLVVVSGWQVYDNKGRVVEKYEPFFSNGFGYAPQTEVRTGQKVTTFYDPRGQVVRTVDPDGSERRVVFGVPFELADPEQFTPTPWEAYTYDANDNAGRTHPEASAGYRNHWNTPASIVVDALGRAVSGTARNGDDPAADWFVTRSTYDIRGNLLTVIDALGRVAFRNVYDFAGRPLRTESIDAGVRRTILDANGNVVEGRDGKGALTLRAYDASHRPVCLWAGDAGAQPPTLRERLVYGDDPDSGLAPTQAVAANLLGKPYRHYDDAGLLTFEAYDFKANLSEKVRQVISDAAVLAVFNTPPADWRLQPFRADWQPPAGITLAAHAAQLLDVTPYRTSLTHDALGRVTSMRYPQDVEGKRRELRHHYNRAGALERVQLDGEPYVERIAYNARGQRTLVVYGNGVMTRHAYDPNSFRLARLRTERFATPAALTYRPTGAPLQDFVYRYDAVGNITAIQDRTPDGGVPNTPPGKDALDRAFTYDPLYRLLSATGRETDSPPPSLPWEDQPRGADPTRARSYVEQYQYDRAGNLTRLRHQSVGGDTSRGRGFVRELALAPGSNRLSKLTVGQTNFDYTYDAGGNLNRETTSRHFEWDYADRMRVFRIQAGDAEPSVYAHYLYDAGGQRVKKLVRKQGGRIEVTVYVGGVFEHQRVVQSGATQENNTLHVSDDQSRIALVRVGSPFPHDSTPAVKFHLGDHLGSSNLVLDGAGGLVNREEYTPYGETSFGGFAKKRYRFTGKERDEESGLSYHGARYYAPWLGRWSSCDPLGTVDGLNLYRFVRNNPVRFSDPHGLDSADSTQKCPGGQCHAAAAEPPPSAEFPPLSQGQIDDWLRDPPQDEPPLPTLEEQGAGEPPSRFNIQCVSNCHESSKVQGNWTGMGPAPDHPTSPAGKLLVSAVAALPGPGTLAHGLKAVDEAGRGNTGAALWSLGHAALTLAPLASLRGGAVAPTAASRDVGAPPLPPGVEPAFKAVVKSTSNAYSFSTEVEAASVRELLLDIDAKYPGAAVYVGSGGHGNRFGSFFARHTSLIDRSFIAEDIESIRALREIGIGEVLDLSKPAQLGLFRNAEQMAKTAGQDHIFTIRAWCFSSRSTL